METSDRVNPWIRSVEPYVPGKTYEGYIKLASNENNYGPSPNVVQAIKDSAQFVHVYPYKDMELRQAAAKYFNVEPENIVAGNGSDEIIEMVFKTFKGPGASVSPSFSFYGICATSLGVKFGSVDLNDDFSFPLTEFIKKTGKAGIILLANPNNPTGLPIPREYLRQILEEGKITVVDEAYFEFAGETVVPWINDYPNLIVLRTLSKAFGLGGMRVGFAIACEETASYLRKVKGPFNVNALAEEAAIAAFKDKDYMQDTVDKILAGRRMLQDAVSGRFNATDSRANFVFFDVSPKTSTEFFNELLDQQIIVREFGSFKGFKGEWVRVTVGREKENERFLKALEVV